MPNNYQESNFDGIYRGENILTDTVNKVDQETGDGFLLNKPLYKDALEGLSGEEVKKIKNSLALILSGGEKSTISNTLAFVVNEYIDSVWQKLGKLKIKLGVKKKFNKPIIKPKYHSVIENDIFSIDGILGNNGLGATNTLTLKVNILGKKYFLKKIDDDCVTIINEKIVKLNGIKEYKGLIYLDRYFEEYKDIKIIKPIFSCKEGNQNFIIYPFIDKLITVKELKSKNLELYLKLKNRYEDIYKKIISEGIVGDIKIDNTFVDTKTHKIYIFDPVLNDNH